MLSRLNLLEQFHYHDALVLWLQKDSLMEISFHIPNSNTQFVCDENRPSAQVSFFFFFWFPGFTYIFFLYVRSFVTKSCQWRMLVQVVKSLLLRLKELRFLLQGEYCASIWYLL